MQIGFRFVGGYIDSKKPHYVRQVKEAMIEVVPRRGLRSAFQTIAQRVRRTITQSQDGQRSDRVTAMIDGEEAGTTPMRITVIPNAVTVLVPASVESPKENEAANSAVT